MSESFNFTKAFIKFVKEDLKIIVTFMVLILFITYGFVGMMGYLALDSANFRTPSVGYFERVNYPDTDGDNLPDIIEEGLNGDCERGDQVFDAEGTYVGLCTETDPTTIDTDGDLFTDAAEDALGSNPTSWINPGFVYLIWLFYILGFIFNNVYRGDPLKEYKEFEQSQSAGVSGQGGKFAYSGSSAFGTKKASEVSDEERKAAIQQDSRFQRMTMEGSAPKEEVKVKRNFSALIIQFVIAILAAIFLFVVFNQSVS